MSRNRWLLSDYKDLKVVYQGYVSKVFKATCINSGLTVALKAYLNPNLLPSMLRHQLMREARLHPTLNHPNVLKMYGAFRDQDVIIMVLEWCNQGDLMDLWHYKYSTRMKESTVASITRELLKALTYLHSRGIVHRDIKLENILLNIDQSTGQMRVKLADFGLAIDLNEEPTAVTRVGTMEYMVRPGLCNGLSCLDCWPDQYMHDDGKIGQWAGESPAIDHYLLISLPMLLLQAPEVLCCPVKDEPRENKQRKDLAYSELVDIWSLSVLAFEMVNGCAPFPQPEISFFSAKIHPSHIASLTSHPPKFQVAATEEMQGFIHSCLVPADKRPSASELLGGHSWVCKSSKSARSSDSGIRSSTLTLQPSTSIRFNSLP